MKKNKVFISHASSDYRDSKGHVIPGNAISEIIEVLKKNHILFWIDEKGLISAEGWCKQIKDAINECNIFLYVSSARANSSVNTANEVAYALKHNKHIIPLKLDMSDFHEENDLNLAALHYLKYYEDREKALRDLVSTIKGIHTDKVVVDTSVKIKNIPEELQINGELLSEKVLSIFNSQDLNVSSEQFKSLLQTLDCATDDGFDSLDNYITRLQNLSTERNYNVRRYRMVRLVSDIKEDTNDIERTICLMMILLKMYLYFCLEDIKDVLEIQKELMNIHFDLSYFEENADNINDIANKTIKAAMLVGSMVAAAMGKGGSLTRGAIIESTKGQKVNLVKTSEKVKLQQQTFETLKQVVSNLVFEDK